MHSCMYYILQSPLPECELCVSTALNESKSKKVITHTFVSSLTLTVLVVTIDAQWKGMVDVGSARYEPALLPPCPTIRVLSYSN